MKRNIGNLCLGFLGGLIAIFSPKLFSLMNLPQGRDYTEVLSHTMLIVGSIIALIIGIMAMVRFMNNYTEPWTVLMLAMSLPGVITSGVVTHDQQNRLQTMAESKGELNRKIEELEGVGPAAGLELPLSQNSQAWPSLVGTAMAQDGCEWNPLEKQSGLLKEEQKDTRLVLSTHTTQADAQAAQAAFNSKGITSRLVASGGRFFLLSCGEWKTKGQVLLDASELKKTIQQTPELKKRVSGTPSYYQAK